VQNWKFTARHNSGGIRLGFLNTWEFASSNQYLQKEIKLNCSKTWHLANLTRKQF
jgi:hypothetical protein